MRTPIVRACSLLLSLSYLNASHQHSEVISQNKVVQQTVTLGRTLLAVGVSAVRWILICSLKETRSADSSPGFPS